MNFEEILDKFIVTSILDEVVMVLQVGKHSCMIGPIYNGPNMEVEAERYRQKIKDMLRQIYTELKNSKEETEERHLNELHGAN